VAGHIFLVSHVALDNLAEVATIEPHTPALRAIADFGALALGEHKVDLPCHNMPRGGSDEEKAFSFSTLRQSILNTSGTSEIGGAVPGFHQSRYPR